MNEQIEKQAIEEMAKAIEEMAKAMCGNAMPNGNCATDDEPCFLECVYGYCAERLYQKDYRKQSVGEWIKHAASYECTVCKNEFCVDGYAEDYDAIEDWDLHFCPNCGAKMKGGAE